MSGEVNEDFIKWFCHWGEKAMDSSDILAIYLPPQAKKQEQYLFEQGYMVREGDIYYITERGKERVLMANL